MKKKSSVLILFVLITSLLGGCFSSSPATENAETGYHYYATDALRIQVPNEWEILTPTAFTNETPKNTIVGFRNNIRNARFTSNVVIIENPVTQEKTTTLDYAKALYSKVKDSLNDFHEIQAEQKKIIVHGTETDSLYTVSQGRESTTADVKQFYYISGVINGHAYIVVGSMLLSEGDATAKKLETIVQSFEIK